MNMYTKHCRWHLYASQFNQFHKSPSMPKIMDIPTKHCQCHLYASQYNQFHKSWIYLQNTVNETYHGCASKHFQCHRPQLCFQNTINDTNHGCALNTLSVLHIIIMPSHTINPIYMHPLQIPSISTNHTYSPTTLSKP